jgi:hypothetical protein
MLAACGSMHGDGALLAGSPPLAVADPKVEQRIKNKPAATLSRTVGQQ